MTTAKQRSHFSIKSAEKAGLDLKAWRSLVVSNNKHLDRLEWMASLLTGDLKPEIREKIEEFLQMSYDIRRQPLIELGSGFYYRPSLMKDDPDNPDTRNIFHSSRIK